MTDFKRKSNLKTMRGPLWLLAAFIAMPVLSFAAVAIVPVLLLLTVYGKAPRQANTWDI